MNVLSDYYKICPTCEKEYMAKRRNQVYCTAKCKTLNNNNKARWIKEEYDAVTFKTNRHLWSIRNFLKEHVEQKIKHQKIKKKKYFSLGMITGFYKDEALNANILVVYDFAYYFVDQETIKIIRNE